MKQRVIIFLSIFFIAVFNLNIAQVLKIYTTLPSLSSITKSVGGDLVSVNSLTKGSQDAHYLEAKPSYMIQLNKADLLIYSGLELEIGWLSLLIQGARNSEIIPGGRGSLNASSALSNEYILEKPRGEVDRTMGDVHAAGNPHFLLDPRNAIDIADLICNKLIELDPGHKNNYLNNLQIFQRNLEKKISEWERKFLFMQGREIVCYHPHWSYLLNWMKLKLAGYIETKPGIPPTPRHKREIINMIKEKNIPVVLVSTWKEPSIAKEVASVTDSQLLILPGEVEAAPEATDYESWIDFMVRKLVSSYSNKLRGGN